MKKVFLIILFVCLILITSCNLKNENIDPWDKIEGYGNCVCKEYDFYDAGLNCNPTGKHGSSIRFSDVMHMNMSWREYLCEETEIINLYESEKGINYSCTCYK